MPHEGGSPTLCGLVHLEDISISINLEAEPLKLSGLTSSCLREDQIMAVAGGLLGAGLQHCTS